jgi:hypothetical protein
MTQEEIKAYNNGINDAIDEVQHAREEGESDMRQVLHWLRNLLKCDKQGNK